ncbi:DUF6843 domain-containing protein [Hymenobacter sp. HD11105]
MSPRYISTRRFGFWAGPFLLVGSLLLAVLVMIGTAYFPPLVFLFLLPAVGLLVGVLLIVRGTQPLWAKLLALLSPVLGPIVFILVVGSLLPAEDHVVFLIPADFRGQVALVCEEGYFNPLPRAGRDIILTVPASGRLTTSDPPDKRWLTNADYYLIDAAGHRVGKLPRLDDAAFDQHLRPSETRPEKDRQAVGIFTSGLHYKRPRGAPDYSNIPGSFPPKEVPYLSFTVSCYDSLENALRKSAF